MRRNRVECDDTRYAPVRFIEKRAELLRLMQLVVRAVEVGRSVAVRERAYCRRVRCFGEGSIGTRRASAGVVHQWRSGIVLPPSGECESCRIERHGDASRLVWVFDDAVMDRDRTCCSRLRMLDVDSLRRGGIETRTYGGSADGAKDRTVGSGRGYRRSYDRFRSKLTHTEERRRGT